MSKVADKAPPMSEFVARNFYDQSHLKEYDFLYRGKKPDDYPEMVATRSEMFKAGVPLLHRNQCAHLLIPLNKCRVETGSLVWKCSDERHAYEKCLYKLYTYRVKELERRKQFYAQSGTPTEQTLAAKAIAQFSS